MQIVSVQSDRAQVITDSGVTLTCVGVRQMPVQKMLFDMGLADMTPENASSTLANYVYPKQAHPHFLYGRSSNQELVNVPRDCDIQVDDFVFLRPTQSEAIIPQFSTLNLYQRNTFKTWQSFRE